MGLRASEGSLADRPGSPVLGRLTKAGPLSFEGRRGLAPLASFPPVPGYGREPVGNGHAAAGFSAVPALGVAAVDGDCASGVLLAIGSAVLAGLAALLAFFFFPAFFFLLADFFLLAAFFLPADFNDFVFFFDDAFFFFFFFPPFFAFFFAIFNLLQGC